MPAEKKQKKIKAQNGVVRKIKKADVASARGLVALITSGAESVKRFSLFARAQHLLLFSSVLVLAITGLPQTFSDSSIVVRFIQIAGGIDNLQKVHHLFAIILITLMVIHLYAVLEDIFVKMHSPILFFNRDDLLAVRNMVSIFFGRSTNLPKFDRYKPDEKFIYWITAFSVTVSFLTGIFLLYPVQMTIVLPGSLLPFAISIHRWQAILLVVVVATLHTYQVLRKKSSVNIFSGDITVEELKTEHPVELEWFEKIAEIDDTRHFPVSLSLQEKIQKIEKPEPETGDTPASNVLEDMTNVTKDDAIDVILPIPEDVDSTINDILILDEPADPVIEDSDPLEESDSDEGKADSDYLMPDDEPETTQ